MTVPNHDPLLAALAAAEEDDEPFTDEERAAVQAGWDAFQRGEFMSWDEVKRELLNEDEADPATSS